MSQNGIKAFANVLHQIQMARISLIADGSETKDNQDMRLGQLLQKATDAVKDEFAEITMEIPSEFSKMPKWKRSYLTRYFKRRDNKIKSIYGDKLDCDPVEYIHQLVLHSSGHYNDERMRIEQQPGVVLDAVARMGVHLVGKGLMSQQEFLSVFGITEYDVSRKGIAFREGRDWDDQNQP